MIPRTACRYVGQCYLQGPPRQEAGLVVSAKWRQRRHRPHQAARTSRHAVFGTLLARSVRRDQSRLRCLRSCIQRRVRLCQLLCKRQVGNVPVLEQQVGKDAHDPAPT
ncbi:hypothetical protein XCCB100_3964 [Xanthomonas campestris pv. campestris]|uniref:Uncharacterized protein n=1 Tax=Xanthomonas campestris pv. campestris (strain B100) TaxID=509169 RepID=B0RWU2_XANCB|nr:hypothetical protein XCCB100_3964 [Xanthomonas campestris pv. campestris]